MAPSVPSSSLLSAPRREALHELLRHDELDLIYITTVGIIPLIINTNNYRAIGQVDVVAQYFYQIKRFNLALYH